MEIELQDLEYEKLDRIGWVWLNRVARKNALGDKTTNRLVELFNGIEHDDDVRVVIISGRGGDFCSGGDFKDTFEGGAWRSREQWLDRVRRGPNRLAQTLRTLSKPVIASIDGVAIGGGATIALACDLRVASENAQFAFPFSKIGLTPEFGCSYLLPRTVGLSAALELLLLGDTLDAQQAYQMGLVHRVVPATELQGTAHELALKLTRRSASSLRAIKELLFNSMSCDMVATLEAEATALADAFSSPEHRAAVAEFLDRRHKNS